jgi:hypothetical protein
MEDRVFNYINDLSIHYKFRAPKYDCRHLLIIMSGFNIPDPTVYDFLMTGQYCRSAILWIKDDFGGQPAYYLCNNMDFKIEKGVSTLIDGVIDFLKPTMTSIVGGSKGGSMALYYGIKHNLPNIISTVPQFNIGSYVDEHWRDVSQKMMGTVDPMNIQALNNYLPAIIQKDSNTQRHVYLFTSPQDEQFETEIKPNIPLFSKYDNFSLIETNSPFVKEHTQVTAYNINLILSIIYQLEDGIQPKLGRVKNGANW